MSKIAIISDTDCSIPRNISDELNIIQVPILVQFGEETFEAAVNLSDQEAFSRIDQEQKIPRTSAPTPGAFASAFQSAFDSGAESALCFCVSSAVSGTFSAAQKARDLYPNHDISIVDTQTLSMAQGFAVIAAAEAAAKGGSKEDALRSAQEILPRTHLFGALSTLKYLALSGRVGTITAGMAGFLNIMPILTVREGRLDILERARTRKKAWARVINLLAEAAANNDIEKLAIIHVNALESAVVFEERLRKEINFPEKAIYAELTPGMSVHTGTGLVGAVLVTK